MKILFTGAGGFLGRHLTKKFTNTHIYYIHSKEQDLRKPVNLYIPKVDYIFHLAVSTKAGDYCLYNRGLQWEDNQLINSNILYYWRHVQPQAKMITFGTSCAYPNDGTEKTEDNYLNGRPDDRLYIYAMTKRMLLIGLQAYAEQFGMKYMYYIPNTLYGPDFDINDKHFIFDLVQKICAAKYEKKEPAILWGSGYQKRELIYIDDAIDLIMKTYKTYNNQIINLATGHEHSIRFYAKLICDYIKYDFNKIEFDSGAFEGALSKQLKPNEKFGKCNQTPLTYGLYSIIDYYLEKKYGM